MKALLLPFKSVRASISISLPTSAGHGQAVTLQAKDSMTLRKCELEPVLKLNTITFVLLSLCASCHNCFCLNSVYSLLVYN